MVYAFPITESERNRVRDESAVGLAYWHNIYPDAADFAAKFPSAVILQFGPALMRKRMHAARRAAAVVNS